MCVTVASEIRAVPLINPGRGGFEELRVHFLTEKEQLQKDRLLKDYLMLIEIPVIGLAYDATRIISAARYGHENLTPCTSHVYYIYMHGIFLF